MQFGQSLDSSLYFEGCIGDATYNGQLLDFTEVNFLKIKNIVISLWKDSYGFKFSNFLTTILFHNDIIQASTKGVSLTGCSFPDDILTTVMPSGKETMNDQINIVAPDISSIQPFVAENDKKFTVENVSLNVFRRS